jgi:hypothetical protein
MPVMVAGCSPARRARALGLSGPMTADEIEAVEVDVVQLKAPADLVVEQ